MTLQAQARKMIFYAFTKDEMTTLLSREDFSKPLECIQTIDEAENLIYLGNSFIENLPLRGREVLYGSDVGHSHEQIDSNGEWRHTYRSPERIMLLYDK